MKALAYYFNLREGSFPGLPKAELEDDDKMVVLQGRVLDRRCQGVAGATIDVWYGAREDQHGENHYRGIMTSIHHNYCYALCAR